MSLAHASRVTTMGQLTASIAHEVSQPVTGAITNANTALRWLRADRPNVAEAVHALELIVRDGIRAREVIDRVRALACKAPVQEDLVEVNGAVREVIELIDGEAMKSKVAVHLAFEDGLPLIRADRVQIQQVILNLVVNAIEAMSDVTDGARDLWIGSARAQPDAVLVSVRDSGVGVDPVRLARVFDPFYSTKPEGLGMGLSICRSIVEAHGGKLWATAAVPHGAIFQFTIPADRGDQGCSARKSDGEPATRARQPVSSRKARRARS